MGTKTRELHIAQRFQCMQQASDIVCRWQQRMPSFFLAPKPGGQETVEGYAGRRFHAEDECKWVWQQNEHISHQ